MAARKPRNGRSRSRAKPTARRRSGPPAAAPNPSPTAPLSESDPKKQPFTPESLDSTVIAIPLLRDLEKEKLGQAPVKPHAIIIDLNLTFPGGRDAARRYVTDKINEILERAGKDSGTGIRYGGTGGSAAGVDEYVFAKLRGEHIRRLVSEDGAKDDPLKKPFINSGQFARAIHHIWPDFPVRRLTNKSISMVKADAARASFGALGQGIVWAVLDTGIDATHPHFVMHDNLDLERPLGPLDFTGENRPNGDPNGHGTHVAGIIAGEARSTTERRNGKVRRLEIRAVVRSRDENGGTVYRTENLPAISGMAPKCKLVSMRVLDANGDGETSSIMRALARIQEINGYGRHLLIHGVNLSLGNVFEPEWFACGQSPLCVEVNRLVQSGVVVVVAAGNSGYGSIKTEITDEIKAGMSLTINDPGNADLAITVGSTHRDMPHMYGVSYFSSKGPTGDGRLKPDIVAPGEKIISCAAGESRRRARANGAADCDYLEDSGTSMAAPHVSGVIAAFLSIRREFIGQATRVKEIFVSTATTLGRERYFQGNGIVDLMRAIQSV
jgi:serine protease AprX